MKNDKAYQKRDQSPKRVRRTPQEAEAERQRAQAAETARREREREYRGLVAEQTRQRLLGVAPTSDSSRSKLDNMAVNIHYSYDWKGHGGQCVTAVIQLKNTQELQVFPQRFMTTMEEYANRHYADRRITFKPGGGSHLHAEMYAVLHFLLMEQNPADHIGAIGTSREICPDCVHVLDYLGIPYTKTWVTSESNTYWIYPWSWLPPSCKPPVKGPREDHDKGGGGGGGGFGFGGSDPIHA
jgi:hypothetical protein